MIYVSAIATWALEHNTKGDLCFPGTIYDFFYETDDEHFFDQYTDDTQTVFYPVEGGKFFTTHQSFWNWINNTEYRPYPDSIHLKPVQFMPISPDNVPEYTIQWIANHFDDFHADWVNFCYKYSPLDKDKIRILWSINEAIEDEIPLRVELLELRNVLRWCVKQTADKMPSDATVKLLHQFENHNQFIDNAIETIVKRQKERGHDANLD